MRCKVIEKNQGDYAEGVHDAIKETMQDYSIEQTAAYASAYSASIFFSSQYLGLYPCFQDQLRKNGFPLVYRKNIAKLEASPSGLEQVAVCQWKFETPERHTSVILDQDQILLQTTAYESFEKFIELYFSILKPVLDITEHGTHGIAGRLGLRYVDQVTRQSHDDDIDSYLRPSMQGMASPYFKNKKKRYTHIEVADTELRNGQKGMLSIRILRNAEQLDLPSDLYSEAPTGRYLFCFT